MTRLVSEIQAVQNPALGAALMWRFTCGFSPKTAGVGTPLPLLFVVQPIVLHQRSMERIAGTQARSGLRKFEEKFGGSSDVLLALQPRMLAMRELSLRSFRIGLRSGLLTLVPGDGVVWPRTYALRPAEGEGVSDLLKAAEKLGVWCSELSLFEVAGILKLGL